MNRLDGRVAAVVLGIMQDGGLPHPGCRCPRCSAAFADPALVEYAASLAIVDCRSERCKVWLIDATPDIKFQLNDLAWALGPHPRMPERLRQPQGILLTHGHMGHTAGLAQLGPEAMNVRALPVYASRNLMHVLRQTALWRPLADSLAIEPLTAGRALELASDLQVTPIPVPHRDEIGGGTFAYLVRGPRRKLLYVPDIDDWALWPRALEMVAAADIALVDATFYSRDESAGRDPVAHPLAAVTVDLFSQHARKICLTHLNHTNPLLDRGSPERRRVEAAGFAIASTGQIIDL